MYKNLLITCLLILFWNLMLQLIGQNYTLCSFMIRLKVESSLQCLKGCVLLYEESHQFVTTNCNQVTPSEPHMIFSTSRIRFSWTETTDFLRICRERWQKFEAVCINLLVYFNWFIFSISSAAPPSHPGRAQIATKWKGKT